MVKWLNLNTLRPCKKLNCFMVVKILIIPKTVNKDFIISVEYHYIWKPLCLGVCAHACQWFSSASGEIQYMLHFPSTLHKLDSQWFRVFQFETILYKTADIMSATNFMDFSIYSYPMSTSYEQNKQGISEFRSSVNWILSPIIY